MVKSDRPKGGATMNDVALVAGVSAMTVSRVINGRSGVSDETREMVKSVIRDLAYTPNAAARSLVTSTQLQIGIIYSNPSAAFMSEMLTGMFEEASIHGARLALLKGENGHPPTQAELEDFADSGLSGFILAPPLGNRARFSMFCGRLGCPWPCWAPMMLMTPNACASTTTVPPMKWHATCWTLAIVGWASCWATPTRGPAPNAWPAFTPPCAKSARLRFRWCRATSAIAPGLRQESSFSIPAAAHRDLRQQ
jgi:hypothetical protein